MDSRIEAKGLILALAAAAVGQVLLSLGHRAGGWGFFVVAVPLLVVALAGRPVEALSCRDLGERWPWRRSHLGLASLAVGCNVAALCLLWRDNGDRLGLLFWLISLGGLVLAALFPSRPGRHLPCHSEIALVIPVLLLAAFLRVYRIQDLPPGVFIDETNAAIDALQILDGAQVSPFATGWFETPTLYAYYMAGLFRLVGVSFFALKLASILPGLLTVAGVYPLARQAFGRWSALLSLFLLATARWHVHMSRWGWNELMPPLFQVLVAYLLLRGLDGGRPRDFVLAGLALGLSQYTYLAARLIPAVVFLFLLHQAVTVRGFLRRHGANLLLLALAGLMAFAPLGLTYLQDPFLFANRARQVSLLSDVEAAGTLQPLWDNVTKHLRMFNDWGDANPRHNLPGAPMLDPFTSALLPLAVGYALYRWRDRRYALLLAWVAVTLLGGVLSAAKEAPQGYRTLGVLPAVVLLVADLVARLWQRLSRPGGQAWRGVTTAGLVAFLALGGYHNARTYFATYARDPRTFWGFTPMETGVARTVSAALDRYDVYVVSKLVHFSSLRFATYQLPDRGGGGLSQPPYRPFSPTDDLPLSASSGRDALIVLETQYLSLVPFIVHYYPEAAVHLPCSPDGQPLYLVVEIPRPALRRAPVEPPPGQGLLGCYFQGEAWEGQPAMQRLDPLLLFHWYGNAPLPGPFSVRWTGEILLPQDGTLELKAGPHPIRVEYFQRSGSKLIEFRWTRPGAPLELVPPQVLRPSTGMEGCQGR